MAKAAQRRPKVAGDGADIAALAADHFQIGVIGIGACPAIRLSTQRGAPGQVHRLAFAGKVIGALAIDLDGGKLRRDLLDLAPEGGEGRLDLGRRGRRGEVAITVPGVIGGGRRAEGARGSGSISARR
jgi:hypothetical protein